MARSGCHANQFRWNQSTARSQCPLPPNKRGTTSTCVVFSEIPFVHMTACPGRRTVRVSKRFQEICAGSIVRRTHGARIHRREGAQQRVRTARLNLALNSRSGCADRVNTTDKPRHSRDTSRDSPARCSTSRSARSCRRRGRRASRRGGVRARLVRPTRASR